MRDAYYVMFESERDANVCRGWKEGGDAERCWFLIFLCGVAVAVGGGCHGVIDDAVTRTKSFSIAVQYSFRQSITSS